MNNILAAKVLMSHLHEIKDGAYKTATKIAIEELFIDAVKDWHKMDTGFPVTEYLGITKDEYNEWIGGSERSK